ncbi:MAG: 50S ribosomal protein L3 [Candidatus Micrarchaeaceae archaeon]
MVRRGSMQYWHRRRAAKPLPRIRSYAETRELGLSDMLAYKVGMTHLTMLDDSLSPSKNTEVARACTVLEVPYTEAYGIRLYTKDELTGYKKTYAEVFSAEAAHKLGIKNPKLTDEKIGGAKKGVALSAVSLLLAAYPKASALGQDHPNRYEVRVTGGKDIEERINFATKFLGKEIKPADIFKNGERVDVFSISKGKGWQGPVKRFGISRLFHKATGKGRHVGTLGPANPSNVLYTVPQAGQMGYHYRSERNKRILKIGTKNDVDTINKKGGFSNYGFVSGDYLVVDGSVPGCAKRIVRVRHSMNYAGAQIKEPKITYISK